MSHRAQRTRVPGTHGRTVRALVIVADPEQPGLSPAERLALRLRVAANVSGSCVCGARMAPVRIRAGELQVVPLEHHDCCPAISPIIDRVAARLGPRLLFRSVVVEMRVAA
jgi:hypothetical protein